MSKGVFISVVRKMQNVIKNNSPEILTGIGIAGMIATTVMAVKATPKAMTLIDDEKFIQDEEKLEPVDVVKTTWKCYIPAAVTGVLSITCLIGSNSASTRRSAALATAYTLSESAFKEYKGKVIETIGEKKEGSIRDAIAKDKVNKDPVANKEVIITEKGNTLCYDTISGRYFKSDIESLKKAVNELNRRMIGEAYISVNDLYYEIGLSETKIGDDIGWNIENELIELRFSSQLTTDGTPCLVMDYSVVPRYDFKNMR